MKSIILSLLICFFSLSANAFNPSAEDVANHVKGCNKHDGFDCMLLGEIYENGTPEITKDLLKAFNYYKKSCNYGESDGCSSLGYLYEKGLGTAGDPQKAL